MSLVGLIGTMIIRAIFVIIFLIVVFVIVITIKRSARLSLLRIGLKLKFISI